ncbi:phosphatidylserine lipase ABHD16A isoform X1 [Diabrotica virgifera virgifera]|uniref:Protein ABHD16A n=1 Tax=Diabrotica virgifera virgifera TaxID=50390 RepID=A0ABM5JMG2_DIAVI|nr:phosphatidylserine lipase ABHD16A isoform X1 [Diabrotica virgifera virgifera]
MPSVQQILACMFMGKLKKIYGGPVEKLYEPNSLEHISDKCLNSLYVIWKLGIYTSPIVVGLLYQRGYFEPDGLLLLTKFITTAGVIVVMSFCLRGYGRATNPTYVKYFKAVKTAERDMTPGAKQELMKYDFDFKSWPVEYKCTSDAREMVQQIPKQPKYSGLINWLWQLPFKIIAYFAIHTFGIRLIYPGTIGFLQIILDQSLMQGRSKLVELYRGERYKLQTADGNHIDTMFVDRRKTTSIGNTLVVCCEGNAGFYEIGVMSTPIEAGYSVLGWNHPGFANSTGKPYPSQEQNAIHAVMQFAEQKLNFKREDIILFGWSIGGYAAAWAGVNYPEVKGMVLDATFDDVLPLAVNTMPSWIEPIVRVAIKDHVDLNIIQQLVEYPGPILLIRRTDDEVICLRQGDVSSNRINILLKKLLRYRYPFIYDDVRIQIVDGYLSVSQDEQDNFLQKYAIDDRFCYSSLQSYISEYSKSYPMKIGEDWNDQDKAQVALYLAKNHMMDFKATHCVNLPPDMFRKPWDVIVESDFVFMNN